MKSSAVENMANGGLLEQTYQEIDAEFVAFKESPAVRGVIEAVACERGVKSDHISFDSDELFLRSAQLTLDFREPGKTRWHLLPSKFKPATDEVIDEAIEYLGMREVRMPAYSNYAMGVVPGTSGRIAADRAEFLLGLEEEGRVNLPVVVFAACMRPVEEYKDITGRDERERAGSAGYSLKGCPAKTEYDIMRNTARDVLGVDENDWLELSGADASIPYEFEYGYKVSYAEAGGKHVFVLSAPVIGSDRYHPDGKPRWRANTGDTYLMAEKMLSDWSPGHEDEPLRALIATNAVFRFQENDARSVFSTVGLDAETVLYPQAAVGQPDWYGGNTFYLQEILSLFRQTYAARQKLGKLILQTV